MDNMTPIIESVLFVSEKPISIDKLCEVLHENTEEPVSDKLKNKINETIEIIKAKYRDNEFGFELRGSQGGYYFSTKSEYSQWVRKFLEAKPFRLGKTTLETLAIIAYKEPITRAEIDLVRGMDSSHTVRALIEKGLIKMAGKSDLPGRPVLYATTEKFLELVGLQSLSDLPPLAELRELEGDTSEHHDPVAEGLEKFVKESIQTKIKGFTEDPHLDAIDGMIQEVGTTDKEVFASREAQETAEENLNAVHTFQELSRTWKKLIKEKKSLHEDLLKKIEKNLNQEEDIVEAQDNLETSLETGIVDTHQTSPDITEDTNEVSQEAPTETAEETLLIEENNTESDQAIEATSPETEQDPAEIVPSVIENSTTDDDSVLNFEETHGKNKEIETH